ncbi:MAG: discoidin domain-containing protein [Lachnospiraceae bacterium]|nr:discoidin domain-containing protein [Lachnospiraceae bacterium]
MEMKNMKILKTVTLVLCIVAVACALITCLLLTTKGANYNVTVMEAPAQSESFTHEAFAVEEYEPVIPSGTNIASLGKAAANGHTDVYGPNKVTDGKTNGASYWEGETDAYPNELTLSFKEVHSVHAIKLLLCPLAVWSKRTQDFGVWVSTDGENYTELIKSASYDFDPRKNNEVVLEFEKCDLMSLKLIFTANTGAGGAQVAELEVYE